MNLNSILILGLTLAVIMLIAYIWHLKRNRPEPTVHDALNEIKLNLVKLILFYQTNYSDSDQLVLIKIWIQQNIDVDNLPLGQWELFKEFINKLK